MFKKGNVPWNKGKRLEGYPQMGFKRGHPVFKGAEKGWIKKGQKPWNTGKSNPYTKNLPQLFKKKEVRIVGGNNHVWKGDEVGYNSLHKWVIRWLGQPDTCEHCGKTGLRGQQIHWANKSQEYKRDLTDWLRLCAQCHKNYDSEKTCVSQ